MDVFYDHFLAVHWKVYSEVPLQAFAREVYAAIEEYQEHIPAEVFVRLRRMSGHDWLCAYGEIEGIRETLRRIEQRMGRPVKLAEAVSVLAADYDGFHADFCEFFPALVAHVEGSGRNFRRMRSAE